MWNWDELKAAAEADFSSLSFEQTRQFLDAATRGTRPHCAAQVRKSRLQKNKLVHDPYNWISYLKPSELMMMGDLDRKEAVNLYKKSTKGQSHHAMRLSFEHCLLAKQNEHSLMGKHVQLQSEKYKSSYYDDAIFVDKNCNDKKKKRKKEIACSEETRCKLDPKERKNMLAKCESYDITMEQIMKDWMMRKKTESNQADDYDGACSETRLNQSDDMSQKNLESIEMARTQREGRRGQKKWLWTCMGMSIVIGAYNLRRPLVIRWS